MKLFTRIYLPFFLLLFSLGGCIKEDFSDCPVGLKIYFDYEPATYARTGIEASEVDRIDVFVFDAQGLYCGVWIDKKPMLTPDYHIVVTDLPTEANYRFIVWGGLHKNYYSHPADFKEGVTTFDEAYLILDHLSSEFNNGINPLFHAEKSQYIDNTREQIIRMPLVQAYNTLNLTTEGLQSNSKTYRMTVYDNNGKYNFDHSFATFGDFTYTTLCNKDAQGQLSARLDILKLASNRNPIFEIADQDGTVLFKENLVALINALGSNNYDLTHTYDIHLKFGLSVSVNINGWWVVEDGNIILK